MSDVEYVQDNNLQPQSVDVEALKNDALDWLNCRSDIGQYYMIEDYINHLASQGVLNTRWQTMDSAPKDGSMFLAYSPSSCLSCYECYWCSKSNKFKEWNKHDANDLTHWMPLPPPPTGGKHE